jgi:hypothetical protein
MGMGGGITITQASLHRASRHRLRHCDMKERGGQRAERAESLSHTTPGYRRSWKAGGSAETQPGNLGKAWQLQGSQRNGEIQSTHSNGVVLYTDQAIWTRFVQSQRVDRPAIVSSNE